MRPVGLWKIRWGGLALTSVLIAGAAGYPVAASAAAAPAPALTKGEVSPTPAAGTPALQFNGPRERIRQLAMCGGIMYAAGDFSTIVQNGRTYTRQNLFSFKATAPYTVTSWAPAVNGIVNSIAFDGTNCADAYIGGMFTTVNGDSAHNLAEISTSTGALAAGFGHSTSNQVETLAVVKGHLLVGGYFKWINGSERDPYFASVSPATGHDDHFLDLKISGFYHYCKGSKCTTGTGSSIYNQQVSHGRTLDLVEGDFTLVGGQPRQQIFMLNLATDPATVTGCTSPQWDGSDGNLPNGYPYQCTLTEAFYIRDAAWAPNDQTVYIATTGYHPWNWPTTGKRAGLCDAIAAFPATQSKVLDNWIEYSGCDSYYSVAADSTDVYAAGHVRWGDNGNACNTAGPGSIPDMGLQGVSASNGVIVPNAAGTAGLYSMDRANAGYMLITSAGLWIASTNRFGSNRCGGVSGHAGICLLPYG